MRTCVGNFLRTTAKLPFCRGVLLGAVALSMAGCGNEEVRVYTVPKEKPKQQEVAHSHALHPHWTVPAGWTEQPGGEFRVGSFLVSKGDERADISIIPLPGSVGGDLENVNRWRNQIGLQPITKEQLANDMQAIEVSKFKGKLFDMTGTDPKTQKPARTIAAVLDVSGTSWFFKMTGSSELVSSERSAFISFLKSVTFDSDHDHAAEADSAEKEGEKEAKGSASSKSWKVPEGWEELPATTMVFARFGRTEPALGRAEVAVSVFPGDVGGLLANVNRWRGQIGLGPINDADLTKLTTSIDVSGEKATLVEMASEKTGHSQKSGVRLVVAIVPRAGQTWFYKMTGDDAMVLREKTALTQFVQSIR